MNEALAHSVLADPENLPLASAATAHTWGNTLVLAPHPDDESLGCGGTIAVLRQANLPVRVVFASDGTRSHPNSPSYPAARLRDVREAEARAALEVLGVMEDQIVFWRYADCAVPVPGDEAFAEAVARCVEQITSFGAHTVLVPWRRDPHCDHRAAWQILDAAVASLESAPRVLEYPIWVWELAGRDDAPAADEVAAWRLDITAVSDAKQRAIAAHVSQTTAMIDDDPEGFRLLPDVLAHFAVPWEIYLEGRRSNVVVRPTESLGAEYFDTKYRANPDPWNFATSPYEAAKYQATLDALPREHYRAAFEIGCSIGVLTAMLAPRCDTLLGVDVSERALAEACLRCQNQPQARFAAMHVPTEFPPETFDLILLSEVGYYLSRDDLARTCALVLEHLEPGGTLVLVHWTPLVDEYPLSGDDVHEAFMHHAGTALRVVNHERTDLYRRDVFERVAT